VDASCESNSSCVNLAEVEQVLSQRQVEAFSEVQRVSVDIRRGRFFFRRSYMDTYFLAFCGAKLDTTAVGYTDKRNDGSSDEDDDTDSEEDTPSDTDK